MKNYLKFSLSIFLSFLFCLPSYALIEKVSPIKKPENIISILTSKGVIIDHSKCILNFGSGRIEKYACIFFLYKNQEYNVVMSYGKQNNLSYIFYVFKSTEEGIEEVWVSDLLKWDKNRNSVQSIFFEK